MYYTSNNIKDLQKLKNLIEQKKNIKKLPLNLKIQKETLYQDLAETYAPKTKNQTEQTKIIKEGQKNQLQAIQNQTNYIEALKIPTLPETAEQPTDRLSISSQEDEFRDVGIQSIDVGISTAINGLLNPTNQLPNFKFTPSVINNYMANDLPLQIIDDKIQYDNSRFKLTPSFFNLFIRGNKENNRTLTTDEQLLLHLFVEYAGGLRKDNKTSLYRAINYWRNLVQNLERNGISYVFLSSDTNILFGSHEVLRKHCWKQKLG